jgi:hypothetical protein
VLLLLWLMLRVLLWLCLLLCVLLWLLCLLLLLLRIWFIQMSFNSNMLHCADALLTTEVHVAAVYAVQLHVLSWWAEATFRFPG